MRLGTKDLIAYAEYITILCELVMPAPIPDSGRLTSADVGKPCEIPLLLGIRVRLSNVGVVAQVSVLANIHERGGGGKPLLKFQQIEKFEFPPLGIGISLGLPVNMGDGLYNGLYLFIPWLSMSPLGCL